ncbi:adventurous-gliding motility protein Z-like isoform X6 [Oncorhynchus clarkii lewisi]|uniref:adventurous-gliding motility protein Z-like isoform X6 n=1 Tax=Oncorhynchus clarkii lewisi TaxID=490388 RepID=UPI0039B99A3D
MGNVAGKDDHGPTGSLHERSHLDLFHTPPSSPSDSDLAAALALAPAAAQLLQQGTPSSGATGGIVCQGGASPSTNSNWSHTLSVPPEWAVISLESGASTQGTGVEMDGERRPGRCSSSHNNHSSSPVSPAQESPSNRSPLEQSWQDRDSGLEPQAGPERAREEMALALLNLLEHHRSTLGLSPGLDAPAGAAELLRRLMVEREVLVEEMRSLKDTLRTERAEWHQFQCDLQVAVSVADRLRTEAEETLGTLRESHGELEGQLAQAHCRQQDTDRELENLSAEHGEACHRLSALTLEHQRTIAELETLRRMQIERGKDSHSHREMEGRDTEERPAGEDTGEDINAVEALDGEEREDSEREVEGEKIINSEGVDVKMGGQSPEELVSGGENLLKGKGVAETYLRNLVAAGEKGCGLRDPRRIVMMSERSRSLSRLPLPTDSLPAQKGSSQTTTSTTLPLCKKSQSKGEGWTAYCKHRTPGPASIQKNRRRTRTQTHCPRSDLRMVSACCCDVMEAPGGTHSCAGVKAAPRATRILRSPTSAAAGRTVWLFVLCTTPIYPHTYHTAVSAQETRVRTWALPSRLGEV